MIARVSVAASLTRSRRMPGEPGRSASGFKPELRSTRTDSLIRAKAPRAIHRLGLSEEARGRRAFGACFHDRQRGGLGPAPLPRDEFVPPPCPPWSAPLSAMPERWTRSTTATKARKISSQSTPIRMAPRRIPFRALPRLVIVVVDISSTPAEPCPDNGGSGRQKGTEGKRRREAGTAAAPDTADQNEDQG